MVSDPVSVSSLGPVTYSEARVTAVSSSARFHLSDYAYWLDLLATDSFTTCTISRFQFYIYQYGQGMTVFGS